MDFKRLFQKNISREESSNPIQNAVREFPLDVLKDATGNFDGENIIGRGRFGVVYKGCLDGSVVAIKRILMDESKRIGILQFNAEVYMGNRAMHKNLLKLQGFCINANERLLVYPFMANGSVTSRLKGRQQSQSPLDWNTRKRVAYGTALALAYLHDGCNPKIIHRDVKADNILLDEDFEAVVADFGLAKLISYEESYATTSACGTMGHIAPEYLNNKQCSDKTDVYGFGRLLLELLSGKKVFYIVPYSIREQVSLFDWLKQILTEKDLDLLIDSDLYLTSGNHDLYPEAESMINVALQCTRDNPEERPKMSIVVRMLDEHGLVGESAIRTVFDDMSNELDHILDDQGLLVARVIQRRFIDDRLKKLDHLENFREALLEKGSLKKTVYKATLNHGHIIAIKRLTKNKIRRATNEFECYLDSMKRVEHPNILVFGAYYKFDEEEFLVYDYLPNGSMCCSNGADPVRGPQGIPFYWLRRLLSLKQVARGLNYIHKDLDAVHGNMKSSNVLFDLDYDPQIQLETPHHHVFTLSGVYTAPERSLSQEADVYSFGVLFLEYLTAVVPSDIHSSTFPDLNEEEWAVRFPEWVVSTFHGDNEFFNAALLVGQRCVARSPKNRPKMIEVIQDIEDVDIKYQSKYADRRHKADYEVHN